MPITTGQNCPARQISERLYWHTLTTPCALNRIFVKFPKNLWLSQPNFNSLVYLLSRDAGNLDQQVEGANGAPTSAEAAQNHTYNTMIQLIKQCTSASCRQTFQRIYRVTRDGLMTALPGTQTTIAGCRSGYCCFLVDLFRDSNAAPHRRFNRIDYSRSSIHAI
jgi:hypothetical protein